MTQIQHQINQPLLAHAFNHKRIKGTYFLTGFVAMFNTQGEPFWEITLSDASGELVMYCRDQSCILGDLLPESLVDIEAHIDVLGHVPYFRCKFAQSRAIKSQKFKCLSQLPVARCAKPHSLFALIELVESISTPYLAAFLCNVILQASVGLRFIQCPASLNYHHNYAGGLLEHSVEVAMQFANDNSRSTQERDLAIVAALLHDVGKTQTIDPKFSRTDVGKLVDHDDLTLELCAKALKELSEHHPRFANHLRHAWTCATPGSRYGFQAKTRTAKQLQLFDRASASAPPMHAIN